MWGGISNLDVTMKEDAARLDEVVILGYGSQRRADVTAAVSQIDGKELQKMPMSNISQGLACRGLSPCRIPDSPVRTKPA